MKSSSRQTWLLLAVLPLVQGCSTSLQSEKLRPGHTPGPGIIYTLPRATFDSEVTFLVNGCRKDQAGLPSLSYEVSSGTVKHYLTPDPDEVHRVPYNELSKPTKKTSLGMTLHGNGMLKSINSEIDDRTAQVMSAAAGTVVNLYKAYTLGVVPTAGAAPTSCNGDLDSRIAERLSLTNNDIPKAKADDEALRAAQKKIEETGAKLNLALSNLESANAAKDAVLSQKYSAEAKQLSAQLKAQQSSIAGKDLKLPAAQAKLASIESALSVRGFLDGWSPSPGVTEAKITASQAGLNDSFLSSTGIDLALNLLDNFEAKIEVTPNALPAPSTVER